MRQVSMSFVPSCPPKHRGRSRSLANIEVEPSTEARTTSDLASRPVVARRSGIFLDQLSTEPLMKAFLVIMGHELFDDASQVPLAGNDLEPYWGKLAVRNLREGRGNVGIIRSPLRASSLPDAQRCYSSLLLLWR